MSRLTNEQIECIDDLLGMLDVEFLDIRYEMVDHIASELEEKEGDFKDNLKKYFITNKLQLLEQNDKAKKTAQIRALKYYFRTLGMPVSLLLFAGVFAVVFYFAQFYMDRFDLSMYWNITLIIFLIPFAIVSWKNKRISMMRGLVQMYSYLYLGNMVVMLSASFIEDDAARMFPQRIGISCMAALMLVLIISLYRCRKQYVGKYI